MTHAAFLEGFIKVNLGVPNVGTNDINRGQCTGLAAVWLEACVKPPIYADGKDYLTAGGPPAYRVEANTPINFPHAGDLISWGAAYGNGHGHVAVVVAANVNQVVVFEQNNPLGGAPIVATHDYSQVVGWLSWH
jgi:hypothetical protein